MCVCHLTNSCIQRPLTPARAAGVALHLLNIFLLFGAPYSFQSDNGTECNTEVIRELNGVLLQIHLVHSKARQTQIQAYVERTNCDNKARLAT